MMDVDEAVTFTLLRGAAYLKDNRLPPAGFKSDHPDYEVASIEGSATLDSDFNRSETNEGTGADVVHYRIAGLSRDAEFTAKVELAYQSIGPEWLDDLFSYDTEEVEDFQEYYEESDKSPTVIAAASASNIGTAVTDEAPPQDHGLDVIASYPNPFVNRLTLVVDVRQTAEVDIVIYDLLGRPVRRFGGAVVAAGEWSIIWDGYDDEGAPLPAGQYVVQISSPAGTRATSIHKIR
jgi:hypothetical protein